MVEVFSLVEKLRVINRGWQPIYTLYLYWDPAYYTNYGILGPYKNYFGRSQTPV